MSKSVDEYEGAPRSADRRSMRLSAQQSASLSNVVCTMSLQPPLTTVPCPAVRVTAMNSKPEPSNTMYASRCVTGRKSCAITTARRLGEFLGDERIKVQ